MKNKKSIDKQEENIDKKENETKIENSELINN